MALSLDLNLSAGAKHDLELLHNLDATVKEMAFSALFAALPISFYWLDAEGTLLGCNEKVLKDLKIASLSDFVGHHSAEIVGQAAWENSKQVMLSGKTMIFEETHSSSALNPNAITYLSIKSPIFDNASKVTGLLGISIDISERKRAEEELKRAKEAAEIANEAKTQFILNMEHDLKTPISHIIGCANLLRNSNKKSDPSFIEKYLGHIEASGTRFMQFITTILESIRDVSEKIILQKNNFDLRKLVNEVAAIFSLEAEKKQLLLQVDYPAELPTLFCGDDLRLHRILLNLLSNAVKFTRQGEVKVTVRFDALAKTAQNLLKLTVSDSGIGIPADKHDFIFERFVKLTPSNTNAYPGTGLGLWAVKQFIQDLGGKITVQSAEQEGASFICEIPLMPPQV